jgi:hypothetical protein
MRLLRAAVLSVAFALNMLAGCGNSAASEPATPRPAADTRVYECPMACVKPGESEPYTQVGPGDCPVCGMHLAPRAEQPPAAPAPAPAAH